MNPSLLKPTVESDLSPYMGYLLTQSWRSWMSTRRDAASSTWWIGRDTVLRSGGGSLAATFWKGTFSGPSTETTPTILVVRQEVPDEGGNVRVCASLPPSGQQPLWRASQIRLWATSTQQLHGFCTSKSLLTAPKTVFPIHRDDTNGKNGGGTGHSRNVPH